MVATCLKSNQYPKGVLFFVVSSSVWCTYCPQKPVPTDYVSYFRKSTLRDRRKNFDESSCNSQIDSLSMHTSNDTGVFVVLILSPLLFYFRVNSWSAVILLFFPVYPDGRVCISILHAPGDDPMGYESPVERWSPVQSVEKILLSVVSMLAGQLRHPFSNIHNLVLFGRLILWITDLIRVSILPCSMLSLLRFVRAKWRKCS